LLLSSRSWQLQSEPNLIVSFTAEVDFMEDITIRITGMAVGFFLGSLVGLYYGTSSTRTQFRLMICRPITRAYTILVTILKRGLS
jgi:ABC-type nitrate/sulfonate/bicarbonate transport system permease component